MQFILRPFGNDGSDFDCNPREFIFEPDRFFRRKRPRATSKLEEPVLAWAWAVALSLALGVGLRVEIGVAVGVELVVALGVGVGLLGEG